MATKKKKKCKDCGKIFEWAKNLKTHQRIQHAAKRPNFVCPETGCERSCTTSYNLQIHLRDIHSIDMDLEIIKTLNDPKEQEPRK